MRKTNSRQQHQNKLAKPTHNNKIQTTSKTASTATTPIQLTTAKQKQPTNTKAHSQNQDCSNKTKATQQRQITPTKQIRNK